MERIKSITYLRAFSAVLIFFCHIFFIGINYNISMWLNIGVPIFFSVSAYLMAKKDLETGVKDFYLKRIKTIFIPYEIYLWAVILVLFLIGQVPKKSAIITYSLGLSGFSRDSVLGLGHFWFITILLICYLITPVLFKISKRHEDGKVSLNISLIVSMLLITAVFVLVGTPHYAVHIGGYIYIYFRFRQPKPVGKRETIFWCLSALCLSVIRVVSDMAFEDLKNTKFYFYYDSLFQHFVRLVLAVAIFYLVLLFSYKIQKWSESHQKADKLICGFSGICYEVYLTHQFIQLSVWEFFPDLHNGVLIFVWIIASAVLTILNSLLLSWVSQQFNKIKFVRR